MMYKIKTLAILLLLLSLSTISLATHIRAGEIIAERISDSQLRYRFSIIGYTDTDSGIVFGNGTIDFGDGTVQDLTTATSRTIPLGDEIEYNIFIIEHTFQGAGTYLVRYNELNRNAGVVNMSNSVDTPFDIKTELRIDPIFGRNDTPYFTVAPIDRGAVGAKFLHNPGAVDPDNGDSLSYHLTIPQQFLDRDVNDYKDPNDPSFYAGGFLTGNQEGDGEPTFFIDPITGTLEWDAPGLMGEYNVAFVVKEWRRLEDRWYEIGSVTRDMQIIIEESDNLPPEILQPADICVEAGQLIEQTITATDPNGDAVIMEAFGGPFETINPATFSPDNTTVQPVPAELFFSWNTDCLHVREQPYEVQIKAKDQPAFGPKLADFKTWLITVVGPAPTGLTTTKLSGREIRLDWDQYSCGNADRIEIWRRVDSFEFVPDECIVGIPANAGYELIDVVNNSTLLGEQVTSYTDTNLAPGALYCYRIVAKFPEPAGGESYASNEACAQIGIEAPVVLNVDVVNTGVDNGEIFLRWLPPFEIELDYVRSSDPLPFIYYVVRFEGQSGMMAGDTIAVVEADDINETPLTVVDMDLNTEDNSYHYVIHLYDSDVSKYIDSSSPASSVWLDAVTDIESITLNWEAEVPWSNTLDTLPYQYHRIYRDNIDDFLAPDELMLIDSVNVSEEGFRYVDDGFHNDVELDEELEYRYYVETKGSYGNPILSLYDPLLNKSQLLTAQLKDTVPPCSPVNFMFDPNFNCETALVNRGCEFDDFSNMLMWDEDGDSECDNDISSYNIYYADADLEELPFIQNVTGNSFLHENLNSFKGCYEITSVDRSGIESERSDRICQDNCPFIRMPNAFTPNGDGVNDFFTPFIDRFGGGSEGDPIGEIVDFDNANCPRFVSHLEFNVFDRSGGVLFSYDSRDQLITVDDNPINNILINWDGTSNGGLELESGIYYYGLEVEFDVLDPDEARQNYKGWINLLR